MGNFEIFHVLAWNFQTKRFSEDLLDKTHPFPFPDF